MKAAVPAAGFTMETAGKDEKTIRKGALPCRPY